MRNVKNLSQLLTVLMMAIVLISCGKDNTEPQTPPADHDYNFALLTPTSNEITVGGGESINIQITFNETAVNDEGAWIATYFDGVSVGMYVATTMESPYNTDIPSAVITKQHHTVEFFLLGSGEADTANALASLKVEIERVLEIGDAYAGGIVFFLEDDHAGGLVCAWKDQNDGNGMAWASQQDVLIGTTGESVGSGQSNTSAIVNVQGADSEYAARLCDDLDFEGFTDWFLPSKDELNLIYVNLHAVATPLGDFQNDFYWSSTEDDEGDAWLQDFGSDGDQYYDAKNAERLIRAIRRF